MIVLATMALAAALIPAIGGRFRRLARVEFSGATTVAAAMLAQGVLRGWHGGYGLGGAGAVFLWGCCCAALILVLWGNRRYPGVSLMIAGIGSNCLVVLLNGWMPVVTTVAAVSPAAHFYRPVIGGELMVWMGDVLPLPGGWMVSIGDALLLVGVVVLLLSASCRSDGWRSDSCASC